MDQLSRSPVSKPFADAVPSNVNFVVENVAGGGGLVGTEQGLTRAADGYTIVGVNGDLIINRAIGAHGHCPPGGFYSHCLPAR